MTDTSNFKYPATMKIPYDVCLMAYAASQSLTDEQKRGLLRVLGDYNYNAVMTLFLVLESKVHAVQDRNLYHDKHKKTVD